MAQVLTVTLDGTSTTIDLERLTFAEGRAIEKVAGLPFQEALQKQDLTAIQAIIWVALKRHQPGIKFSDLDDRAIADIDIKIDRDDEPESPYRSHGGLEVQRARYLGVFAEVLGIRPWEFDLLTLAEFAQLVAYIDAQIRQHEEAAEKMNRRRG